MFPLLKIPAAPALLIAAVLSFAVACGAGGGASDRPATRRIQPEYDASGRLRVLRYDSNGDGRTDTWSHMDGGTVLRVEIDRDEDGRIDRWEYYGANQQLEKIGLSRANDGRVDAWAYYGAGRALVRLEISTRRDGAIGRTEHFENGTIARAEEDSNADGRIDKWERYEGGRLVSVALDTGGTPDPDQRLVYGADGSVRVEVLP